MRFPIFLGTGRTYDAVVLADTPVAFWPFKEPSGTSAADVTGNGHTGTYSGGFTLGQTGIGDGESAVLWNGSTGHAAATVPFAPHPYSLESWMYWTAASLHGAAAKWGTATDGVAIGIGAGDMDTTGTHLIVLYENIAWEDTGLVPAASTWHHVVLVVDGSAAGKVYLDGSGLALGSSPSDPGAGAGNVTAASDGSSRWFPGSTAKLAVYNYALTSGQVAAHYAAA